MLESLIHETWAYVGDVGLKWARARDKHTAATAGKMEAAEVTKDKSKNYSSGLKRVRQTDCALLFKQYTIHYCVVLLRDRGLH